MYFTFNGRKSTEFGITISKQPNWATPEPRAEVLNIAGLNGVTVETHGYLPYIINMDIIVEGRDNIDDIRAWLKGKGYYTRSEEPNNKLWVEMQSAPSFRYVVDNLYTAPLTICVVRPEMEIEENYREKLEYRNGELNSYICVNNGNFPMRPKLEFNLKNKTQKQDTLIIRVNGTPIRLTINEEVKSFIVDFSTEKVYDKVTKAEVGVVVGPPTGLPRLNIGENQIYIQEDMMWYGFNLMTYDGLFSGTKDGLTVDTSGKEIKFTGELTEKHIYSIMDAKVLGGWNNGKGRTLSYVVGTNEMAVRPKYCVVTKNKGLKTKPISANRGDFFIEADDEILDAYIEFPAGTGTVKASPQIGFGLGHIDIRTAPNVNENKELQGKEIIAVESIYSLKKERGHND